MPGPGARAPVLPLDSPAAVGAGAGKQQLGPPRGSGRSSGPSSRFQQLLSDLDWYWNDPNTWHRPDDQKKTLPDQWALLQSRWRFLSALLPYLGPPSHSFWHIGLPVSAVMAMCVGIKYAEGHVAWQLDQYNNYAMLFRLSSFVLSLLLAFRANRTYDRWWQARTAFGGIGGGLTNIVRTVTTWTDDARLIRHYQKWGMAMVYSVVQLINDTPKVTDPRVRLLLEPDELALYESTTKPGKLCGTMLGAITAEAGFGIEREIHLNEMLGLVAANVSQCARIKLQAIPHGMSLFCSGYMFIWLLLLPFGIFPEGSWSALLPVFMMATMMLGLEDLANQMEDPFCFFPFEAMVATTAKDMPRTVRETQACKAMLAGKYAAQRAADPDAAAIPPWPELKLRPQRKPRR